MKQLKAHIPYITLPLLLVLYTYLDASAKKSKADTTDYSNTRLHYIFIEPIALIDVYNQFSLRLGAEFSISRRYSAGISLGTYNFGDQYCVKAEAKRYFAFQAKRRYYISILGFYKNTYGSVTDHSRTIPKDEPGYDISYNVKKQASYINVNAGIVSFHKHHLIIDGYCGVGLRYRNVSIENITPSQTEDRYHHHESFIDNFTNSDHKGWAPNISLGIRVGFRY